jgi:hypothetical protein
MLEMKKRKGIQEMLKMGKETARRVELTKIACI